MDMIVAGIWIGTALLAFLLSERLCKWFIPTLRRLKFGQTIREEGPSWHQSKQGTPTMGGLLFIAAMVVASAAALLIGQFLLPNKPFGATPTPATLTAVIGGLLMAVGFGVIGFVDDYIKVVKKRNLGLTSRQKLLLQIVVAAVYAIAMYLGGATRIKVPFYGMWDAGLWFIPLTVFVLVAMTNATNLTDGVDGLCGSVGAVTCVCLLMLCGERYLGNSILAAAMLGALAGFLVWNLHPARVFMGDTGALFIGAVLCAVTFGIGRPFLLVPIGIVYVCETLSVVLQVSYFKLTHGKRLFKMSPIHHHFEMCGWSENKIVLVACGITAVGCAVGLLFTFVK